MTRASSLRNTISEIGYELGTMTALQTPPTDSAHLARWNAGIAEIRSGLDILTRLAEDIEAHQERREADGLDSH